MEDRFFVRRWSINTACLKRAPRYRYTERIHCVTIDLEPGSEIQGYFLAYEDNHTYTLGDEF